MTQQSPRDPQHAVIMFRRDLALRRMAIDDALNFTELTKEIAEEDLAINHEESGYVLTGPDSGAMAAGHPPGPDPVDGNEDGLRIPEFLRARAVARRLTPERLQALLRETSGHSHGRTWVMPDRSKYEVNDMAKKKQEAAADETSNVVNVNPDLPVEVNITLANGKTKQEAFDNYKSYEDWFSPAKYTVEGAIPDESVTMVSLREIAPARAAKPTAEVKKKAAAEIARRLAAEKTAAKKGKAKAPAKTAAPPAKAPSPAKKGKDKLTPAAAPAKGKAENGAVKHKVRVNGAKEVYGSVFKAFEALRLSVPRHQKFRKELKLSRGGKLTYEEGGKKYQFELVSA